MNHSASYALPFGSSIAQLEAALQQDWEAGRPETILDDDGDMGTIRTVDNFIGYVAIQRLGRPLSEFRSIQKNGGLTWRVVFAKNADGQVVWVGKLRKDTAHYRRAR